jgi:hypothetical protein
MGRAKGHLIYRSRYRAYPPEGKDFKAWSSPCAPPYSANVMYSFIKAERDRKKRIKKKSPISTIDWVSIISMISHMHMLSFLCSAVNRGRVSWKPRYFQHCRSRFCIDFLQLLNKTSVNSRNCNIPCASYHAELDHLIGSNGCVQID